MKRALLLPLLLACDASGAAYLYSGSLYDPQLDCVLSTGIIDVMEGTDPGSSCAPKCLAANDGGLPVYVSTMCGAAPVVADLSGSNPACAPALAAWARQDFCLGDGGQSNPLDSGSDVTSEAEADAAPD